VAEIEREIEQLGRALEARDRLARFGTAERAESSPAQAGQSAGGVEDHSTPEPEPLPTVADVSTAPQISFQVGKRATIPASPQQRKLASGDGPPARRRKWGPLLAAVIVVFSVMSGGALILMGPLTEIAQDAYRSAVAEMRRLTARENAETEATARKAAEEKALAEEAERKAAEEKLAVVAAARREESRQTAQEKARAEAAREMAEAQARAAADEATKRQAAEDARRKAEEAMRQPAEGKPKSDAQVREQATLAKRAEETELDARQQAEKSEADLNLSEQDRKRVQVALNSLGHQIPTATGYFGPRTRAMIMSWQKTQGLPETGYLTKAQLATLQQQAAAALAKYDQPQRRVKEDPRGTK
jgi:flagellar biosynthesis GTPase FlhF